MSTNCRWSKIGGRIKRKKNVVTIVNSINKDKNFVIDQNTIDMLLSTDIELPDNITVGQTVKMNAIRKERNRPLNQEEVDKILVEMGIEKKGNKIIPEDEVDALLRGLCSDYNPNAESEPELKAKNIQTNQLTKYMEYNILANERLIRGRLPGLENISDVFSTELSKVLIRTIKRSIQINPISIDIVNYGSYSQSLRLPLTINHFVDNYLNNFYIIVDDRCHQYFTKLFVEEEKLSEIEYNEFESYTMYCISKKMNNIVNLAFSKFIPNWKCKLVDQLSNPRHISNCGWSDLVVIIAYEVDIEENICSFTLVIPYTFANQFKKYLKQVNVINNHPDLYCQSVISQHVLDNIVNNIEIGIKKSFKAYIPFKDFVQFKEGQEIIFCDQNIYVENQLNNEFIYKLQPIEKDKSTFKVVEILSPQFDYKLETSQKFDLIHEFNIEKPEFINNSTFQKLIGNPECQKN